MLLIISIMISDPSPKIPFCTLNRHEEVEGSNPLQTFLVSTRKRNMANTVKHRTFLLSKKV